MADGITAGFGCEVEALGMVVRFCFVFSFRSTLQVYRLSARVRLYYMARAMLVAQPTGSSRLRQRFLVRHERPSVVEQSSCRLKRALARVGGVWRRGVVCAGGVRGRRSSVM